MCEVTSKAPFYRSSCIYHNYHLIGITLLDAKGLKDAPLTHRLITLFKIGDIFAGCARSCPIF
jgi:hypothetical protein